MENISFPEKTSNISTFENKTILMKAKELVLAEKKSILHLLLYLMEIDRRGLYDNIGYRSLHEFCISHLKLSENKAWKRTQAIKVIKEHPQLLTMLEKNQISISHIALLSAKITHKNKDIILSNIKNKSKRETEIFLSTIRSDGSKIQGEGEIELKFKCKESFLKKLERIKELAISKGSKGDLSTIIEQMAELYLEKNDPIIKAERAVKKAKKKTQDTQSSPSPGKELKKTIKPRKEERKRYIPAHIRHKVMLRDEGRCTAIDQNGNRCKERSFLEFDHIKMWCHGGENSIDNIRLLCAKHNKEHAKTALGEDFIHEKIVQKKLSKSNNTG